MRISAPGGLALAFQRMVIPEETTRAKEELAGIMQHQQLQRLVWVRSIPIGTAHWVGASMMHQVMVDRLLAVSLCLVRYQPRAMSHQMEAVESWAEE